MPTILLSIAFLSLLIWIVLTFFRGAFWQVQRFDADLDVVDAPTAWPRVLAIVPARNEAETIARAIESLLKQSYRGEYRLIVVDDHSEDGTARLAAEAGRSAGAEERLSIVFAAVLPGGWTGKMWALQQGVDSGAGFAAEYLWFTDADIVHGPDTLERLVSRAVKAKLDLASLMVLLQAKSIAEKLLIPAFLYFFLKLYPPKWIADRKAKIAGAAGGCILLRRTALERTGGIAAIRAEVIDDCALASEVKRSGGPIWMGLTRKSVSLRAYESFGEVRDLVARTAFTQLGYSSVALVGTLLGMLAAYLFPLVFRVQFAANAVATGIGGLGVDDHYVFADRAVLWIVAIVGADFASGCVVLFLCNVGFRSAVLDGKRRPVERASAGKCVKPCCGWEIPL